MCSMVNNYLFDCFFQVSDLGNLIGMYAEWHSHLIPYYSFNQFIRKVEQIGASKRVSVSNINIYFVFMFHSFSLLLTWLKLPFELCYIYLCWLAGDSWSVSSYHLIKRTRWLNILRKFRCLDSSEMTKCTLYCFQLYSVLGWSALFLAQYKVATCIFEGNVIQKDQFIQNNC